MKKKGIFIVLLGSILALLFISFLYYSNIIPHRKYRNEDFGITPYVSKIDQDLDGVDDVTDFLQSVKSYISTSPKYQSKYYALGYPDDGYGVCTDVVAFGLLGAGYDLREEVYIDMKENRELYQVEKIDKNIDFRRVRNLKVYFLRHAISLTTDTSKITEWQGGDIVIFDSHIAVVSDYRNHNGVPFIIHHASPYQRHYEEDILEYRSDIVGHYRIS